MAASRLMGLSLGAAVAAAIVVTAPLALTSCHRADSNAAKADNIVTDSPDAGPYKAFSEAVQRYLAVRAAADQKVPALKETGDPAKISGREKALGVAIAEARAEAKQGDIFVPAVVPEFTRFVHEDFAKRPPADRTAVLEEVPRKIPPKVNEPYPTEMPLATVPPALLLKLPTLPPELEYRFLGRHLILRDIKSNLIVDYIPDIVPA
jgi:hypothetical protein